VACTSLLDVCSHSVASHGSLKLREHSTASRSSRAMVSKYLPGKAKLRPHKVRCLETRYIFLEVNRSRAFVKRRFKEVPDILNRFNCLFGNDLCSARYYLLCLKIWITLTLILIIKRTWSLFLLVNRCFILRVCVWSHKSSDLYPGTVD
jgi:hypothetical protein